MPTPAKPLAVHELQNTKSEAALTPDVAPSRPRYPKGLTGEGRKIWKALAGVLERRRTLTEGEAELLRIYAHLFVRHSKAMERLAEEGEICTYYRLNNHGESVPSVKPNLWLAVAQDAEKSMTGILDRLGLSPLNRAKVKQTTAPKEAKPVDAMEELMRRPRNAPPEDEVNLAEIDEDAAVQ